MVSIRSISLIILIFTSFGVKAETLSKKEADRVTARFQEKQKQTRTFECDLKQTLKLEDVEEPIVSKGRIFYKTPDALLIKFNEPSEEFTLLWERELYIQKFGKKLIHRKLKESQSRMEGIASLLSVFQNGAEVFNETFDVVMLRNKNKIHVQLRPKKDGEVSRPELIETVLNAENYEIHSIYVEFDKNNSITYELTRPHRDGKMDDQIFKQLIP